MNPGGGVLRVLERWIQPADQLGVASVPEFGFRVVYLCIVNRGLGETPFGVEPRFFDLCSNQDSSNISALSFQLEFEDESRGKVGLPTSLACGQEKYLENVGGGVMAESDTADDRAVLKENI